MENCKRGNEFFAQGKYNDALKKYKLATAQDTNNATYWRQVLVLVEVNLTHVKATRHAQV